MAASAAPKTKVFHLLKLPGEVRNMIYHIIFEMPTRIFLDTSRTSRRGKDPYIVHWMVRYDDEPLPSGQLLRVNRQVSQEGLPVLLHANDFTIHRFRTLRIFLEAIKPIGRASIRDLRVYWGQDTRKANGKAMKKTFSLLCECTSLKYLWMCLPPLQSLAAVQKLILADSKDILKPFPRLDKLTLEYIYTGGVDNSPTLEELHSIYQRMAGPEGEFHVDCSLI